MKKVLLLTCALALGACSGYSQGERSGTVSKLSYKGFLCKSWEGELLQGGLKAVKKGDTTSMDANIFEFSVTDSEVVDQLKAAAVSGERVTLVYTEAFVTNPCTQSTAYTVVKVVTQ